jgi:asparagine synthase (glutamine-hydrolysing)
LIFKNGRISLSEYWDIDPSKKFRGTFEDKKRRFLELFRDSVKLHMRSDVEVGGCLSGGLDSSPASVIGKDYSGLRYKTFTIYYKGKNQMDERNWAREVITSFSNMEPVYFSPSDDEVAACFDRVMRLNDVPIHSSSPISYYFIMKVAAQNGIKVMLDGQGSDEYLPAIALVSTG